MLKKILIVFSVIIILFFIITSFQKDTEELNQPAHEVSLGLRERFSTTLSAIDTNGDIYIGILTGYPETKLRKYNRQGKQIFERPFRDEDGFLLAQSRDDEGEKQISQGVNNQGWQGFIEVDNQGNIILIDPGTEKLHILDEQGYLTEEINLNLEEDHGIDDFTIQDSQLKDRTLYLKIQVGNNNDNMITIKIDLKEKSIEKSNREVGISGPNNKIYYTTRKDRGLFSSDNINLVEYNQEQNQVNAEHQLPISWDEKEWRREPLTYHPEENTVYFMEWKTYFDWESDQYKIKKYNLETEETTTFARFDSSRTNINTLKMEIHEGLLYLFLDNNIYLYEL